MRPVDYVTSPEPPVCQRELYAPVLPRRDVRWVLRNAAIAAVLGFTAAHLTGVACLAAMQQRLARMAAAAATVAALPKTSLESVREEAMRQLQSASRSGIAAHVELFHNNKLCRKSVPLQPGDRVRVSMAVPGQSALPVVLGRLAPWLASEEIQATAEARVGPE